MGENNDVPRAGTTGEVCPADRAPDHLGAIIKRAFLAFVRDPEVRAEIIALQAEAAPQQSDEPQAMSRRQVAKALGCAEVTLRRAGIEPDFYVGDRGRFTVDSVRRQLAERGRAPTTPIARVKAANSVDVSDALARASLRVVAGGGRTR